MYAAGVWASPRKMAVPEYPVEMDQAFRQRLQAAGLDPDAINVILKTGGRADVEASLALEWAASWDGEPLRALAALPPADRQHSLAAQVDGFLQNPVHLVRRVAHAATQTRDADLRAAGLLAVDPSGRAHGVRPGSHDLRHEPIYG